MRIYKGYRTSNGCRINVIDGQTMERRGLSLEKSLEVANHSPTGFEWGYGGSGPAQTALAILLDFFGDKRKALKWYQQFKWDIIASFKGEFEISEDEISYWIEQKID